MEEQITSRQMQHSDLEGEHTLRPQYLSEYCGQSGIKENLSIYIEAAKMRGESLDHVLFYGPPVLGKTPLAGIISNELGVTKASVSKAIQVLREDGMVSQEPYGGVRLTPNGLARGMAVLCRHRLLFAFLTQELGIDEQTAEREACGIEHAISDASFERWLAYASKIGLRVKGLLRYYMEYNQQ